MKLTLTYRDGTTLTIDPVQSIRVTGLGTMETATYGNTEVKHRHVASFSIEPFDFSAVMADVAPSLAALASLALLAGDATWSCEAGGACPCETFGTTGDCLHVVRAQAIALSTGSVSARYSETQS